MLKSILLATLMLSYQPSARRVYTDNVNGIRFSYPGAWLLNGDDDAATAKLRISVYGQPAAVVQLEGSFADTGPYKGTDFEAGAFAYVVTPDDAQASCFDRIDQLAPGSSKPALVSRQQAREIRFSGLVAGTEDLHRAMAVYQSRRCFLFETVLIRRSTDTGVKPLDPQSWRQITSTFDAVLHSVRLKSVATH